MGGKAGKKGNKKPRQPPNSGVSFELRSTRAAKQLWPGLEIRHDEDLPTEYGIARQFDVSGRSSNVLKRAYEARDHNRNVSINQVEGFAKKLEKLIDKPETAGIISSRHFSKPAKTWVQHYQTTELVRELYTLKASSPDDFEGDYSKLLLRSEFKSLRLKSVRFHSHVEKVGQSVTVAFNADRRTGFLYSEIGRVLGNVLDLVNTAMQDALKTNELGLRTIALPPGSFIRNEDKSLPAALLEIEFEEFSIPSTTVIDQSGRFPDVLQDVLSGKKWLIEDKERALKASRTGLDLTLAFPDASDPAFVDIHSLTVEQPSLDLEKNLRQTAASLSLAVALAGVARNSSENVPREIVDLLKLANDKFAAGEGSEAKQLYLESFKLGTSLQALCNLAFLAFDEQDYEKAAAYSAQAALTFPLQPIGFTNLAAALIAAGRLGEARAVLANSRFLHGPSALFRRQEAELLFLEGKIQDAAHIFYSIVIDDPTDASALANLARCEASLGDLPQAAWDASRSFDAAPSDPGIAEFAARISYQARQYDSVLQIVDLAQSRGLTTLLLSRFALNAAIERKQYALALDWLQNIPKSEWSQPELILCGKLHNLVGDYAHAVATLREASAREPLEPADKLWMAESLVRAGSCDEALSMLAGLSDADAISLRAHAYAQLGRAGEMIETIQFLEPDRANTLCIQCLDHLLAAGHLSALKAPTAWLLARESADPAVLTRQTSALSALASDTKKPSDIQRATARLLKAREAGVTEVELAHSQIFIEIASGREDVAMAAAANLRPDSRPDIVAMLATRAFGNEMFALASMLADRVLASEEQPVHIQLDTIVLERLLVAFRLGQSRAVMNAALARSPPPSGVWGRLAEAVIRYLDG